VGLDPAANAIEHARGHYGLQDVHAGTLESVPLPAESFDVVFTWHVIEHVLDLDNFLRAIRSVLRPDGILCIGTENYPNACDWVERIRASLAGTAPPFATSSAHTFLFSARSLDNVLARRGFRQLATWTYQHPWRTRRRTLRFRTPLAWAYMATLHLAEVLARTGPRLQVIAAPV
jgi:2-polyprenyl-3-methyl-5-hydroxy-6-metoxy-1,4-benzoquinol methylase